MYEIVILNLDKERIVLDVTAEELKPCLQSIEEEKTFHCQDKGFFFPKANIRCVAYQLKQEQKSEEQPVIAE